MIHNQDEIEMFDDAAKNIEFNCFGRIKLEGGGVVFYGVLKESEPISRELMELAMNTEINIATVSDENGFWNTKDLFD